jgi:hypothetical protein
LPGWASAKGAAASSAARLNETHIARMTDPFNRGSCDRFHS